MTARRFFVPEVVQTSGMDCGPATLKALLEGFGTRVSYGRLREACHTDVDGTSIDTLEEIAQTLGLDAEQVMLPADHVLLEEASALPAIAVARTAAGAAHFIVIWRCHGPLVQILDPASGRLWISRRELLVRLYQHSAAVDASAWREWAGSTAACAPLERRLKALGLSAAHATSQIESAASDPSWRRLARLDAGTRMTAALVNAGAIAHAQAASALIALLAEFRDQDTTPILSHYWSVQPAAPASDGTERLSLRGAVLVRVRGRRPQAVETTREGAAAKSPELAAALNEPPARPLRHLMAALAADGAMAPVIVACAVAIAAMGVVFEGALLRSVLDISALLTLPTQGIAAAGALALFGAAMLGIEVALAAAERQAGSRLEARLRIGFLAKMPRLADSYFQSRPIADMLERSHASHILRVLPQLAIRTLRIASELVLTTLAIAWIDPRMAGLAVLACAAAAGIPLLGSSMLAERDLKVRTHTGALARFQLDALLGRTAIEAHGAEATIEREHDRLLGEWSEASMALQRGSVVIEGLQMLVGLGLAAGLLFGHWTAGASGAMLLVTYWVLNLPALGYELALAAREYPAHRNTMLRILEPLGAPDAREETPGVEHNVTRQPAAASRAGVHVDLRRVSVRVAGNRVLENIDLCVGAGTHVAIVGSSGAGKSTLVGILLGWFRPAGGEVVVDGEPLTAARLDRLRHETAWVDPTLQVWNRSLLDNILYGVDADAPSLTPVLESAALLPVVARLPQGLSTPLGEGGSLLSAGERQRVRLGRALMRQAARLVILDEPFLGLERERRRQLLAYARHRWAGKTLLYVTHDVSETRGFDRVLVMDRGRIVEDGEPQLLAQMPASRYRRLLAAQETVQARLTTGAEWKRIRLEAGDIVHEHGNSTTLEQRA